MIRLDQALQAHHPAPVSARPDGRFDGFTPVPRGGLRLARSWGLLGFAAGSLTVLTVQSAAIAALYAADAPVPFPPWSMAPVPPFGVPQTLSAAFWGGLWGVLYAYLEPRLTAWLGRWRGGIAFGALPLPVLWFVAFPLKGLPVGAGFDLSGVLVAIALHASFGLGVAIFFKAALQLGGRRAQS